jgi:hypothetical protein
MTPAAQFLTPLRVEQVNENDWRLTSSLRYWSAILDRMIVVPEGFVTDFASVPRLPFVYWFTGGKFQAAAVIHDWLYRRRSEKVSRAEADAVLAEAMKALGYWLPRQWFVWAGVRIGGYWSFEKRP